LIRILSKVRGHKVSVWLRWFMFYNVLVVLYNMTGRLRCQANVYQVGRLDTGK
jgi:hypothetical protein